MPTTSRRVIQLALKHEHRLLLAVVLFPLLAVMVIAVLKLMPRLHMFLIREDSLVEWATAIVFCLAAGFAAALTLHFRRQKERVYALLYAILAVGLLLGALEEISWGQRQLGFATPQAIEALNQKSESNFHNMEDFPLHAAFIFVGFYGAFSRLLAAPVLGRRYPKVVELLTPPLFLFFYFFIPFALYSYYESPFYVEEVEHLVTGKDQEPIELLLSLGFLLFTVLTWARYRVGAPMQGRRERADGPRTERFW